MATTSTKLLVEADDHPSPAQSWTQEGDEILLTPKEAAANLRVSKMATPATINTKGGRRLR